MANHNRAGQPAQQSDLINVAQLTAQYYVLKPEVGNAEHAVKFGTSGHRGSAVRHSFNEPHILAIAQAIAEERAKNSVTGPCYVGKDTHALSEPAFISVLEVLAANGVDVIIQENNGYTPTPAVSNAILVHNQKGGAQADAWTAPSDGVVMNALQLLWAMYDGAGPLTVTHFSIWDASTGGNMLVYAPLASSRTINPGDVFVADTQKLTAQVL